MTKLLKYFTPGPGTFKPFGSFNLLAILILFLESKSLPSYEPGPGTLLKSYLSLF